MNIWEAPFLCHQESRIPNSYIVFLHTGYSPEQHRHAVGNGTDLDSAIDIVLPGTERHGLRYSADLTDSGLAAVRAESGVDKVECHFYVHPVD